MRTVLVPLVLVLAGCVSPDEAPVPEGPEPLPDVGEIPVVAWTVDVATDAEPPAGNGTDVRRKVAWEVDRTARTLRFLEEVARVPPGTRFIVLQEASVVAPSGNVTPYSDVTPRQQPSALAAVFLPPFHRAVAFTFEGEAIETRGVRLAPGESTTEEIRAEHDGVTYSGRGTLAYLGNWTLVRVKGCTSFEGCPGEGVA